MVVTEQGKDWDLLIPYSYRKVPQASTGFSPFKLVYGHQVHGPLNILHESCESSGRCSNSVIYILAVQKCLTKLMVVWENLTMIGRPGMIVMLGSGSLNLESKSWFSCQPPPTSYWQNGRGPTWWYNGSVGSATSSTWLTGGRRKETPHQHVAEVDHTGNGDQFQAR